MQKILLLFGIIFFVCASPVSAANNVCNKSCQVNEDCGGSYRCYVGICRASACPSSANCGCISATPTPVPQIVANSSAPTPQPKATPIASPSTQVESAPVTGAPTPLMLALSAMLALFGVVLSQAADNA